MLCWAEIEANFFPGVLAIFFGGGEGTPKNVENVKLRLIEMTFFAGC